MRFTNRILTLFALTLVYSQSVLAIDGMNNLIDNSHHEEKLEHARLLKALNDSTRVAEQYDRYWSKVQASEKTSGKNIEVRLVRSDLDLSSTHRASN
jgi:hypothetical protein